MRDIIVGVVRLTVWSALVLSKACVLAFAIIRFWGLSVRDLMKKLMFFVAMTVFRVISSLMVSVLVRVVIRILVVSCVFVVLGLIEHERKRLRAKEGINACMLVFGSVPLFKRYFGFVVFAIALL